MTTVPKPKRTTRRMPRGVDLMSDGRFRARVRLPDGSRKAQYARTLDEAADLVRAMENALRDGALVTNSRRPLADWLDQWLADYVKPKADAKDSPRPDPNADDKAITPDDLPTVERVMADLDLRHAPAWRFLVDTGLRWGEASALRWSDVHLDGPAPYGPAPYVSVRRANTRVTGGLKAKAPKSRKGRRNVPLTDETIAALKVQERRCKELKIAAAVWGDNDLVFPGDQGQPLRSNRVLETFEEAQRAAGLTDTYTLHQLRHTYATRHFANGTHPEIVQDLLGHERIEYTLGIYTSSIPEASVEAVRNLPPLSSRRRVADG